MTPASRARPRTRFHPTVPGGYAAHDATNFAIMYAFSDHLDRMRSTPAAARCAAPWSRGEDGRLRDITHVGPFTYRDVRSGGVGRHAGCAGRRPGSRRAPHGRCGRVA